MATQRIPGVRQAHTGALYQYERLDSGAVIIAPYEESMPRSYPQLEWITLESKGKPGTFYRSMAIYQNRSA